jgi:DNA-binding NarL/FixJ family response regulator
MAIIKYIIADDHKIFRQGLKLSIMDDHKLKCVGEAANGEEVLELLPKQKPDVILLDIKMPGMDGIATLNHIREMALDVKVIIVTMFEDDHFIIHLMEAGANGYLFKSAEPEEIKTAIKTVFEHGYYFNDQVSTVMLKTIVKKDDKKNKPQIKLNERELQVLKLICEERTAQEIGQQIFLSARTVEGIKSSLIEKLDVRNTTGLVVYALRNGIVE